MKLLLRMISSVQKGSEKKRWMNLTAEAVLLQNYVFLNYSPFLNLGTLHESSWSLKNSTLYYSSKVVAKK